MAVSFRNLPTLSETARLLDRISSPGEGRRGDRFITWWELSKKGRTPLEELAFREAAAAVGDSAVSKLRSRHSWGARLLPPAVALVVGSHLWQKEARKAWEEPPPALGREALLASVASAIPDARKLETLPSPLRQRLQGLDPARLKKGDWEALEELWRALDDSHLREQLAPEMQGPLFELRVRLLALAALDGRVLGSDEPEGSGRSTGTSPGSETDEGTHEGTISGAASPGEMTDRRKHSRPAPSSAEEAGGMEPWVEYSQNREIPVSYREGIKRYLKEIDQERRK
jgi:hypothetical protein